jgi:hypothetical protein
MESYGVSRRSSSREQGCSIPRSRNKEKQEGSNSRRREYNHQHTQKCGIAKAEAAEE